MEGLDRKTESLVFDKRTMTALYKIMEDLSIGYIDYPVSSGKESVVFKAFMKKKPVALKIFKISTIKFSTLEKYIYGDRRFEKERKDRSTRVFLWCRKEFINLQELHKAGVNAPIPIGYNKNVLVMQYLGSAKSPAPLLKNCDGDFDSLFKVIKNQMWTMYNKARLVHADLSEYNILVHKGKPYFIDVGQTVDRDHPSADEFLERDIFNICNFFRRKGVPADAKELLKFLNGEKVE